MNLWNRGRPVPTPQTYFTVSRNVLTLWAISLLAVALSPACATQPGPAPSGDEPAAETETVRILAFNDFHGHLQGPVSEMTVDGETVGVGGAAALARHVEAQRNGAPHTAVVVAGDLIGASPLVSALFHDEPTIEAMNQLGLTAVSVGNHEFDEGWQELQRMARGGCHPKEGCFGDDKFDGADFPFLAANVLTPAGETLFEPYVIREYDGVKVGYIGVALDSIPSIVIPSGVKGLTFTDEAETINRYAQALQKRGVETIVALVHEGGYPKEGSEETDPEACPDLQGPILEIAEQTTTAVDLMATGHTHQTYICNIDGHLVTSAGDEGRLLTRVDLTIDRKTGDVVSREASQVPVVTDAGEPTAVKTDRSDAVERTVRTYAKLAEARAQQVVGHVTEPLSNEPNEAGESPLGSVVADAQLAAARKQTESDLALMNPGGLRAPLGTRSGEDGSRKRPVTFGDLHRAQPFRNRLVTMTMTGAQLHRIFERQWEGQDYPRVLQVSRGVEVAWHPDRPLGKRVDPEDVTIDGERLRAENTYRVTVNNYLAEGGDNFETFTEGTNRVSGGLDIDAMRAYLEANSPVSPPEAPRIERISAETTSN
jgi:5'-nucleotidase